MAPGEAKNTYGTGAFMLMNTGMVRPSLGDGLLTTIACDATGGPCYALEAAIFIAGAAVQWIRDGLGLIATAAETEALASGLASNDGGLLRAGADRARGAPLGGGGAGDAGGAHPRGPPGRTSSGRRWRRWRSARRM